jgi:hypothetical protein
MTNVAQDPTFFYDEQIRRNVLQFMAIFSNMYVEFGAKGDREPGLVPVFLTYGHRDRVVAHIKSDNTQNKPLRLPAMAANLTSISMAPDRAKGQQSTRRDTYLKNQGVLPDDVRTIYQRMPVPYDFNFELSIYTTNYDEHWQILEQILTIFDPSLSIQTSTDTFDWTKIKQVDLVGIGPEQNYPSGPERRIIVTTLAFVVKGWLSLPSNVRDNVIRSIQLRVGIVSDLDAPSSDIIAEIDAGGFDYNSQFDFSEDVDLQ